MDTTDIDGAVAPHTKDPNEQAHSDPSSAIADESDEASPPPPFILAITPEPESESTPAIATRGLPSEKTFIEPLPPSNKRPRTERSSPTSNNVNSNNRDPEWRQWLYSPHAGTTITGSKLLQRFEKSGFSTPSAMTELEQYSNYEFENFTFLQEIIPNLFLGRYSRYPCLPNFRLVAICC